MSQETIIIHIKRHFLLKLVSLACLTLCYPSAFAIGFGSVVLRSNLGETLRLQVPITGVSDDILSASCIKPTIETLDGELIDIPQIEFVAPTQASQPTYINLTSKKVMVEPAMNFTIAMTCGAFVKRVYPLLLDFAGSSTAVAVSLPSSVLPDNQISAVDVTKLTSPTADTAPGKTHVAQAEARVTNHKAEVDNLTSAKGRNKRPKHRKLTGKDVLKVVSEDSVSDLGLKLSDTLGEPLPQTQDQQRLAENRAAQAQFSALLRGEDPLIAAQNEIKRLELKSKNLQAQLDKINQQDALKDQKDRSFSPLSKGLFAAVTALILVLAGLVVVLLKARKNKNKAWWDASTEQKKNVVDIVDYLQASAEEGNLDPNPITTSPDNTSKENSGKVETTNTSINKVEPTPKFKRMGLLALEDTNSSTFNFSGNRGQSIHIEEISDITQEAEFWMSVNDPHRAIEILEPASLDDNQTTPVTWLYLLDLYRLVSDENNYRVLRHRFKRKFNANIPNFNEEILPGSARSLEDFPHLISNCCALWHTENILSYLESLLVDDREGERVGFDLPVYRDILFLLSIYHELRRVKYKSMPKEEASAKENGPVDTGTVQEKNLNVKPEESESNEHSNSLNFDLPDFKSDNKKKG